MDERLAMVAEIRALQAADQQWRAEHPDLALPGALLDVITSCGFQYYAEHDVTDDVRFLDRAIELLEHTAPPRTDAVACVRRLERETRPLRADTGDLDAREELRHILVGVPPDVLLGRRDEEASPDLVCRHEAMGLVDGITTPYRCASRISALASFSAPDRYGLIDEMVALRERYEKSATERGELDDAIRAGMWRYLEWSQAGT